MTYKIVMTIIVDEDDEHNPPAKEAGDILMQFIHDETNWQDVSIHIVEGYGDRD